MKRANAKRSFRLAVKETAFASVHFAVGRHRQQMIHPSMRIQTATQRALKKELQQGPRPKRRCLPTPTIYYQETKRGTTAKCTARCRAAESIAPCATARGVSTWQPQSRLSRTNLYYLAFLFSRVWMRCSRIFKQFATNGHVLLFSLPARKLLLYTRFKKAGRR